LEQHESTYNLECAIVHGECVSIFISALFSAYSNFVQAVVILPNLRSAYFFIEIPQVTQDMKTAFFPIPLSAMANHTS
jgi:hypothetical protein